MSDLEHPIEGDPCSIDFSAPECTETGLCVVVCELCGFRSAPRDRNYAKYTVRKHTVTLQHRRKLRDQRAVAAQ